MDELAWLMILYFCGVLFFEHTKSDTIRKIREETSPATQKMLVIAFLFLIGNRLSDTALAPFFGWVGFAMIWIALLSGVYDGRVAEEKRTREKWEKEKEWREKMEREKQAHH